MLQQQQQQQQQQQKQQKVYLFQQHIHTQVLSHTHSFEEFLQHAFTQKYLSWRLEKNINSNSSLRTTTTTAEGYNDLVY